MSNLFAKKSWSPYLVGVGIGMLSWFAFWSADHPLGITTLFEHTAALVLEATVPRLAESNSYYLENSPKIGWEWMLVVGVFLGSVISSFASGDREPIVVPPLWKSRFGSSAALRLTVALLAVGALGLSARRSGGGTPRLHEEARQRHSAV
ncbi:YeeE/YedE thiosulfate transporter family protein [Candidatus Laterigemmans baculatus]|uniref:YeeE/YedE thiosulfate transporter family protein n=1 Tax=Candidatus Laterigemmans baculatus TaxID=2770505 RepID=UPI0013DA2DDD|nr:YeeE/YedE thiosulfate transporter family protein [Candidatus Laterigemmans baculatus]